MSFQSMDNKLNKLKQIIQNPTKDQEITFVKSLRGATTKGLTVKMDKAVIQKEILDKTLELISQIEVDEISDVDFTTSEFGDSFRVQLNIEFKSTDK